MELKFENVCIGLVASIIVIGALGAIILGIILLKTSVLLGIGVFVVGQLVSVIPVFFAARLVSKVQANTQNTQSAGPSDKAENTTEESFSKKASAEEANKMMQEAIDKYFK